MTYEEYVKIRDSLGYKDSTVAKYTGIHQSTFTDWKNGRSTPKKEKMDKIESFLHYNADQAMIEDFIANADDGEKQMLKNLYKEKEVECVARAYANASKDIQNAVCKLLDVDKDYFDHMEKL